MIGRTVLVVMVSMLWNILLHDGCRRGGAHAWEQCSASRGGGTCPDGNTCCLIHDVYDRKNKTSGCIPSDLGVLHGTCCQDDLISGCGVGYQCGPQQTCQANPKDVTDPLVQTLPRYRLCHMIPSMQFMYGLELLPPHLDEDDENKKSYPKKMQQRQLAYYSSHGPLEKLVRMQNNNETRIQSVLIVIHGAGRNADDYFCSAMSASAAVSQHQFSTLHQNENAQKNKRARGSNNNNVLVIAPRFASISDGAIDLHGGGEALRWGDIMENDWRYGASASSSTTSSSNTTDPDIQYDDDNDDIQTSSFFAIDCILRLLQQQKQKGVALSDLKHIVVAGHSSGGQFVQRWALLSPYYNKNKDDYCENDATEKNNSNNTIPIRAVVANPSSYAYLTPLRKMKTRTTSTQSSSSLHQKWRIVSNISACPRYNSWEWGLDTINDGKEEEIIPAYVRNVLQQVDKSCLISRFAHRNVVYLAGERDVCNVSGNDRNGWCFSHGLETTCMDQLQGWNRLERHMTYYEHLTTLVGITGHERAIVTNVGHDHSLMFHSPVGLYYLFHFEENDDNQDQVKETAKTTDEESNNLLRRNNGHKTSHTAPS